MKYSEYGQRQNIKFVTHYVFYRSGLPRISVYDIKYWVKRELLISFHPFHHEAGRLGKCVAENSLTPGCYLLSGIHSEQGK